MRIVIVTEQYLPMLGGVATVTQNLSQDLAAAGHQVWIVAPSEGHHSEYTEYGNVRVRRFASFEWPTYNGLRIAFPPVTPLRRLLRDIRPDVIHIHSPIVLGNLAQLLGASRHVPVIATNHYMPINMAPALSGDPLLGKSFESLAYSYLVGFYNRCDFVTAPTATALDLLKRHGLRAPSRPISNGIDLQRFSIKPRDEALRRRLGLPSDRPIILYIGRLSEEKRVSVLLDAMAQVHEPAHLAIGGAGPAYEALAQQAVALGIERRVTLLGRVPDEELVPLYRLGDVFAMPSVAELQSVAALEALAVGLPVVAADAGALPELIHDGENGFLFASDDSSSLAEHLTRLVSDGDLRRQMLPRCVASAAQHDRQLVLQEWQHLYAYVAARAAVVANSRRRTLRMLRPHRGKAARPPRRAVSGVKPLVVARAGSGDGRGGGRRRARNGGRRRWSETQAELGET
jgi:glycosyltransferase involved in cell wall biosynthesis